MHIHNSNWDSLCGVDFPEWASCHAGGLFSSYSFAQLRWLYDLMHIRYTSVPRWDQWHVSISWILVIPDMNALKDASIISNNFLFGLRLSLRLTGIYFFLSFAIVNRCAHFYNLWCFRANYANKMTLDSSSSLESVLDLSLVLLSVQVKHAPSTSVSACPKLWTQHTHSFP